MLYLLHFLIHIIILHVIIFVLVVAFYNIHSLKYTNRRYSCKGTRKTQEEQQKHVHNIMCMMDPFMVGIVYSTLTW